MQIQPFSAQHSAQIIDLWNRNMQPAFPMTGALFSQNTETDSNVLAEGSAVVLIDGEVQAVVVSKIVKDAKNVDLRLDKGWIHLLLVDARHRQQGIGTQLLKLAEQALAKSGIRQIQFGGDLLHYLCGVPAVDEATKQFLLQRGYIHEATMTDLTNTLVGDVALPQLEEIQLVPLQLHEKEAFLQFMARVFPGRWQYEAIVYFEKGGTGKEFVVAKKGAQMIGFCRMNDAMGPTIAQNINWAPALAGVAGGIGPLGIDAAERKAGYGLAITQAAVHYLQQRGVETILIDWTTLIAFYGKLGFMPWQQYDTFGKAI